MAAVIHSGWAQRERERSGREERGVAVVEGKRKGRIKQNNLSIYKVTLCVQKSY